MQLAKGQKVDITKTNPRATKLTLGIGWYAPPEVDVDTSAFLLGLSGKVLKDEDFIFYSNPSDSNKSVMYSATSTVVAGHSCRQHIKVDLNKIPQNIDRVAITITIYEAQKLKQNFGQVSNLLVHIINEVNGTELFSFDLSQGLSVENALVVGELYRHNGHWKFYANGSGFHGGLEALCRNFGIDVSSDTEPPPSVPVIQPIIVPPQQTIRSNYFKDLSIHEDIKHLLWLINGPKKNYMKEIKSKDRFEVGGLVFTVEYSGATEPSAIDVNMTIAQVKDKHKVERPSYYPSYGDLSVEQRGVYWHLLLNPYDKTIDIGYVFILYYGLERHLLKGNFEDAFRVILKLRDVHENRSFQYYSGNALVLTCLYHQRPDMIVEFIKSLDKDHEMNFSDNLFLFCAHSFNIPIKTKDIIRMAKTFEFDNRSYIKKYPEIFEQTMSNIIFRKYGTANVNLNDYIMPSEFKKIKSESIRIFANISLTDFQIKVPIFANSFKLKKNMFDLLEATHEGVKIRLAELRKKGELKAPTKEKTPNKILLFDSATEKELLAQLRKVSKDPVQTHFSYTLLQEFYYKFRSLNDLYYLNKCIEYCLADIYALDSLQQAYMKEEIASIKRLSGFYSKAELQNKIEEIKSRGFQGNIPAFKRLAIIYESKGQFEEAIDICRRGIEYGRQWCLNVSEFENRTEKLKQKSRKVK